MRKIYHVLLGLLGVILMLLAFLANKIFGIFAPKETKAEKPWVENFVVLYINKCLIFDADITDLNRFSRGDLASSQLQSLVVYLKAYLHKIGETYEPSDIQNVLDAIPKVWNIHIRGFQSESAVRTWCMDQSPDGPKENVDAFIKTLKEVDKTSEDWADLSRSLLKSRFARVFTRQHSEDFISYTDTMLEDHMASASGST